ncbi:MAG TPA: glycerophosphodiester phosphodiesterase family protein [Pyrinomonadaceae bacterium]|nr:glycerophosphodiester phosphodiesterase family protein [Pyrinomonadaceae bacterium]
MKELITNNSPLIIGHRGASAHAPENTLAAFQLAIDAGADGVEFDVQLAKDGVPVVIHDARLKRTGGRKETVAGLTSKELGKIDVGSWFNKKYPKRANADFAKETVPTLAQVLRLLKSTDGLIYIELKATEADYRDLAKSACDVIRDSPLLPRIIVKSFKLAAIPEIRHYLPQVQTAALFAPQILDYLRRRKYIIAMAREFGAHQISLHRVLVTKKLTTLAAQAAMPVTIWTADDPKWVKRCQKLGIGALITNDPARSLAERTRL